MFKCRGLYTVHKRRQNIDLNSQLEQDTIELETGKQSDYKTVSLVNLPIS